MDLTPRVRRALSTALAVLLAFESVSAVAVAAAASTTDPAPQAQPASAPSGLVLAESGASETSYGASRAAISRDDAARDRVAVAAGAPQSAAPSLPAWASLADRPAGVVTALVPGAAPGTTTTVRAASGTTGSGAATARYAGSNHVWIPSLGIDRPVAAFACDRSRPPDNLVYRWGCAGANNVYLMGHAYSVFKSLHDVYVAGRLKIGMRAWYADAGGTVREYAVAWWKVTRPTTASSWAWAAQARPSMTLQTCVGANSAYRLIVRLVAVRG